MMSMAHALTDASKQVYGFVGRGVKNANVVLYEQRLARLGPGDGDAGRQEAAD